MATICPFHSAPPRRKLLLVRKAHSNPHRSPSPSVKKPRSRTTSLRLSLIAFVVAVAIFLWRSVVHEAYWPRVQGTVQGTRLFADPGIQTNWDGPITWKAEYRVVYSVASREYAVWADSGIRRDNKALVQLSIPNPLPLCSVHYNPKKPEVSVADCR
jgi:hypothetical protein